MTIAPDIATAGPVESRQPLRTARLAFRHWRHTRPFWAGIWAMLGGAIIAYVPGTAFKLVLISNGSLIIGVLVGVLVGVFGLMLWFARPLRMILGVLILLLSLVSFFTSDFGGLLVGMLAGLVGGSLALAWVPTKVTWRQRRRARKAPAVDVADTADVADVVDVVDVVDVADVPALPEVLTPSLLDAMFADGPVETSLEGERRPRPSVEVVTQSQAG